MNFRIADTFTESLSRLTGDEQKAVKTTAFDLQLNPANPGMSFHKLDRAKDDRFWSVRVTADIRLIVHKSAASLLHCYVDHHDKAYQWAERRKLEVHPSTGAAQFVEIRQRVEEVRIPKYIEAEQPKPKKLALFANTPEQQLLSYGVPKEWLDDVRVANEDTLLDLTDRLPGEAAEALLELATGGQPKMRATTMAVIPPALDYLDIPAFLRRREGGPNDLSGRPAHAFIDPSQTDLTELPVDPFEHPDAKRRFRVIANVEELEQAFAYPWEKWTIFLHPDQRELVERDFNGPARVSGSAGTGKTIVAVHRAAHLARKNPDGRVLLTTFSDTLANALREKLKRLIASEPRLGERIDVQSMNTVGLRLYERQFGRAKLATRDEVSRYLATEAGKVGDLRFGLPFLLAEWEQVVDEWQISTWEEYRDVKRLGRKTRLSDQQRASLWAIFDALRKRLQSANLTSHAGIFAQLTAEATKRRHPPYEYVIVDESQDIGVAQLKFLAAISGDRQTNALFFAGDLGQRIFQQPFSWKSLGVDVRGRSRNLRVNYRTSHQIRMQADRLLGQEVSDVDGHSESRRGVVSVFNGPVPELRETNTVEAEISVVTKWLIERIGTGFQPHEIGIFVRSDAEIDRAQRALASASIPFVSLDDNVQTTIGKASVGTMHLAKGLEFRAVAVMACDDEVIPLQSRIEQVTDDGDLEEVYATERHLLYVACTRAREQLLVSGVMPVSEFLDDLDISGVA